MEINDQSDIKSIDIIYSPDKDFYKGVGGELRLKAEGLFKKAKEKGISIDEISIVTLRESSEEFPGVGTVELPAFFVKVRGRDIYNNQTIVDCKQIDYLNRYKKYLAEKIEGKNYLKDERGKKLWENGKAKIKEDIDFNISEWERFQAVKSVIEDKEFGLEKTVTGACDRVIRKLMGENDWLYPEEARLLDEEYNNVQGRIEKEQEERKSTAFPVRKATDRQISYLKTKLKNLGLDADDPATRQEILKQAGFEGREINDLTTSDMSKIIDNINSIAVKVKETATGQSFFGNYNEQNFTEGH